MLLLSTMLLSGIANAATGNLVVKVETGGQGDIFLDGQPMGLTTPATLENVPTGNHMVQVKGDCVGAFTSVDVAPNRDTIVELELQPAGGFTEIVSTPDYAEVTIDGTPIDMPFADEVTCGEHTLQASAEGFVDLTRKVNIEMGEAHRFDLRLIPAGFGSVTVEVEPSESRIFIGKDQVAIGSATINQIPAGEHTLRAELDGYTASERTITVQAGQTTELSLTLEKAGGVVTPPVDPPGGGGGKTGGGNLGKVALIGGGVAVAATGGIFVGRSESTWKNDYLPYSSDAQCGAGDNPACISDGEFKTRYDTYKREATIGWALVGVGAAAIGGGTVLFFVNDDAAWVGVQGSF